MEIPLSPVLKSIMQILGVFVIGWLARRKNFFQEEEMNQLSRFISDWLLPCLIFSSIVKNFEPQRIHEFWLMPFIGFFMVAFGAFLGIFLKKGLASKESDIQITFHHFCAINNFTFLPIIIIQNLFGEVAVARLFFLNLGCQIGLWTLGVGILDRRNFKEAINKILSPSIIAIVGSLAISTSGLKTYTPDIIITITQYCGSIAVPLILLIIGSSLYNASLTYHLRDILYLSVIRLILFPFLFLWGLSYLNLTKDALVIAIVVGIMPVALSSTALTRRFGGSPLFAASAALFTTLASMVTVPVWLYIIRWFLKTS